MAIEQPLASADMPAETTGAPTRDSTPFLEVEGLTVSYTSNGVAAVVDVDLQIASGERVALIGESGSGKSTVCLAVAGFLPSSGVTVTARSARLAGADFDVRPARGWVPRARPGLAITFQDAMTSLDPVWTVGAQFRAVQKATGIPRNERRGHALDWLARVGLGADDAVLRKRPFELSGGMRQRVMLALVLASGPRILVADEPTSALDSRLSREMMTLLLDLADRTGTAVLVVSHDIELASRYCDRTMVMYGGRVVESGPSAAVLASPRHPYTFGLLSSVPTIASAVQPRLTTIPLAQEAGQAHVTARGCPFRSRCGRAVDACVDDPPTTAALTRPEQSFRCWNPRPEAS